MAEQVDAARIFYDDLNVKCNFKTRVNAEHLPNRVNEIVDQLGEETMRRYYGSGMVIPEHLEGSRIIDLGCGSGSLVFTLAKLVGPTGHVVGVRSQPGIDTAKSESEYHYKRWGYSQANFEFHCYDVQKVLELGFQEGSFDAVVSNGVFCLCPDKSKAFEQAYRLLKTGGQFLLSDVLGEVKQPEDLKSNEKLWCLGIGCLLWNELSPVARGQGFTVPHLQQAASVNIKSDELKKQLNYADYLFATYRLFKLPADAERSSASVTYFGNLEDYPESLPWDIDLELKKGQPVQVDGELATILSNTVFAPNFSIEDYSGSVTTKRDQNPFQLLRDLAKDNKTPPFVYDVE